jgi:hypothetical protein
MAGSLVVSDINGSGFAPTNLVINPEFTINQRGAATRTTTSSAYNFDRWYYDGTNLLQGVENNNLRATTYVLNWEGSSTCGYSLNTAAASGQGSESYTSISKGGTITISSVGSNNLWLKFTSDLGNLNKVMLVQGVETSIFVARPYGTELALCQRYFCVFNGSGGFGLVGSGVFTSTANARVMVVPPVEMRANPTGGQTSANVRCFNGTTEVDNAGFASISQPSTRVQFVNFSGSANFSATQPAIVQISNDNTGKGFTLSAEL